MSGKGFRIDATSQIKDDKLSAYLAATTEPELTSIPGIGEGTAKKMASAGVENTYQLVRGFRGARAPGHALARTGCEPTRTGTCMRGD